MTRRSLFGAGLMLRLMLATGAAAAALPTGSHAQQRTSITGQVVEQSTRRPIQGARVTVAGTAAGANTDPQGRFAIPNIAAGTRTLQVTMLGYQQATRQVTIGSTPVEVNFELRPDALGLDELVVVGYGEERRRNVAGAVASLRPETIEDMPIGSVNEALQGRLAGVQVTQNSGNPGSAISVRVRGSSSISAGNEPLYVIDGVPVTQGNFSTSSGVAFGGQGIDALSDLNPNDIESIEVLKDASAAAIYGSRASNGVVLITTKRGTATRSEVSFGGYYGMQSDVKRHDLLNAEQYIMIYNEGCVNRYGVTCVSYTDEPLPTNPALPGGVRSAMRAVRGVDTNWMSEVLRDAPISNFDASVRGGTERARYYVAGSAFTQEGTVQSMGFQRLNGRVNLDYVPLERLTLGTNVSLAQSIINRGRSDSSPTGILTNAIGNPPTQPVYGDGGTYFPSLYMNPVGILNEAEAEERGVRILGNTFASYSLVQGVNARLSLGLDQYTNRSHTWDSPVFGPYSSSGGSVEDGAALASRVTYEGTINFNRALGTRHDVSGVVGASYEDNATETNYVQGTQLPNEFFKYVTSAATISGGTSTRNDWALVSGFGRVSYTFDDRVTATFNVRRDGSSRFGAENRFGTFPSASLLWRVGEEGFMQNQDLISNLALRVSYGRTGNQQGIGNFASRGLFSGTNQGYNDQPGISQTQLANPALRWETTDQLNVGTDFSVLNDRLSFTADYYDKQTRDLLTQRPVPRTTGFSSIWDNVGSIENKGFEVAARAQIVRGTPQAFNWTANVNVSRNRNKVTALYNGLGFNSGTRSIARAEVGYPLGSFYGYVTDGLFQEMSEICFDTRGGQFCAGKGAYQGTALTRPGDIRFKDLNGDGLITAADRTVIGSPWPDYEGGITNTLSFGGLDLTAFVHFSRGNQVANLNRVFTDRYGSGGDNNSTRALQRWTPENRNTTEPRAVWGDPNGNAQVSDRFIEDGSYWRLKNAVLGYTLPGSVASRLGIGLRTARVYVQGQNLFTSTNYSGLDPEVNYLGASSTVRGVDFYTLPQARTITAGFNVGL